MVLKYQNAKQYNAKIMINKLMQAKKIIIVRNMFILIYIFIKYNINYYVLSYYSFQ